MKNITMFFFILLFVVVGNVVAGDVVLSDGSLCNEEEFGGMIPNAVGNGYDVIELQDRGNVKSPRFKAKRVRILDGMAKPTMDAENRKCVRMYGDAAFGEREISAGLLMPGEELVELVNDFEGVTQVTDVDIDIAKITGAHNTRRVWKVVRQ